MEGMKIYLIGFMGAGKSTVAPILADKLGLEWVDTDDLIEEKEGLSIPEIFEYYGEDRFRELERETIEEVSQSGPKVVAVGGGAPMDEKNWKRMKSTGEVVYLEIGPEEVLGRVGSDGNRPLLAGLDREERKEKIDKLLKIRHPRYNKADHVVLCNGTGATVLADEITRKLAEENELG
ncbi:MAG: shikimate kinase [Candidatus Bipolaricaulota bacterium]|nr:shikimate kinase [Candidatus Bipolaricaulota bacterium]MBS3791625.1 shikimate kinase [Candidatus Bipolaricaulota bacterium]